MRSGATIRRRCGSQSRYVPNTIIIDSPQKEGVTDAFHIALLVQVARQRPDLATLEKVADCLNAWVGNPQCPFYRTQAQLTAASRQHVEQERLDAQRSVPQKVDNSDSNRVADALSAAVRFLGVSAQSVLDLATAIHLDGSSPLNGWGARQVLGVANIFATGYSPVRDIQTKKNWRRREAGKRRLQSITAQLVSGQLVFRDGEYRRQQRSQALSSLNTGEGIEQVGRWIATATTPGEDGLGINVDGLGKSLTFPF